MSPPIVADASPLIGLAQVGLLRLLRELYGTILVPPAVLEELKIAERRPGYQALGDALADGWLASVSIETPEDEAGLERLVGRGERQAILLAGQRPCRFLLIDDRSGRAVAERRGIPVVGTGGVLLVAKERGLISSVRSVLDQLEERRFRLSIELRRRLLDMAGEEPDNAVR